MFATKLEDLSDRDKELVIAARDILENAYAPYSGFAVGSAVRTTSGKIYSSANLENASYGVTICAEVGALTAANSGGDLSHIEAIAIVGLQFFPTEASSEIVTPCGRCRQLISEASQLSKRDIQVFACSGDLQKIEVSNISELLPNAFGPGTVSTSNPSKPIKQTRSLKVLRISRP